MYTYIESYMYMFSYVCSYMYIYIYVYTYLCMYTGLTGWELDRTWLDTSTHDPLVNV